MKSVTEVCVSRPAAYGLKADHSCKIVKPKMEDSSEMAACLSKLKDLVPTIPHGRKISKVQLLQHVIDYILDLEIVLDTPLSRPVTTPVKSPLSENTELNTLISELTSQCVDMGDEGSRPPSK